MIPFSRPVYFGKEIRNVFDAVKSTWISDGKFIDEFEEKLQDALRSPASPFNYVLATSNGTSALMLAYLTLGLKPGDEVIVPGFCFQAAANVAIQMGIIPVFADVEEDTWNVSIESILNKITSKTKAIVVVHNYGNLVDVLELRSKTVLPIIEDASEAIFSRMYGIYSGTIGDIGTYSFHATKTITTGEGGAITSHSNDFYESFRLYRSHGLVKRGTYNHIVPGNNFRMTNMQAALGVAQIDNYKKIIELKEKIFANYGKLFSDRVDIIPQLYKRKVQPVIWSYAIKIDPNEFTLNRDHLIRTLKSDGIELRPGFISSDLLEIYDEYSPEILPVSRDLSDKVLVLPSYSSISESEQQQVVDAILKLRR